MTPLRLQPGRWALAARGWSAWWWALWLVLAGWVAGPVVAQTVLPVPALTARVMDQTGTLSDTERQALEAKLAAFEAERGSQVVVVLVPTTAPEDIVDYTQRLGDAWKIGRRDVGDGVLLVVAKDDRRVRIATTRAVEGAIPDLVAHRIIDQVITPAFREGRFADGLNAGADHILARLRGEDLPLPEAPVRNGADADEWVDLLVFVGFASPMIAAVLRQMLGGKLGSAVAALAIGGMTWHLSGLVWLAVIVGLLGLLVSLVLAHLPAHAMARNGRGGRSGRGGHGPFGGGGGWGSGHGGGGGFSSGGGGGFGGGGASGRW